MNVYRITIIFLIFLWLPVITKAKDEIKPWSTIEKKAAIAGCRAAILEKTTIDVMERRNLSRDELPEGFDEKIALVLEPVLEFCDCSIEKISKEWTIEYFQTHQDEVANKTNQIIESGACTIDTKELKKSSHALKKNMAPEEETNIEPLSEIDCDETTGACRLNKIKHGKSGFTPTKE